MALVASVVRPSCFVRSLAYVHRRLLAAQADVVAIPRRQVLLVHGDSGGVVVALPGVLAAVLVGENPDADLGSVIHALRSHVQDVSVLVFKFLRQKKKKTS